MSGSGMTLNVDRGLVKPIVEAEIQAAIVRELEKDTNLVPKLVQAALQEKVDQEGKRTGRSYDKYLFIDVLCRDAIQKAAVAAMREYIDENVDTLRAEIKRQIKASAGGLAEVFVNSLVQSLESKWSFTVRIDLPGQD